MPKEIKAIIFDLGEVLVKHINTENVKNKFIAPSPGGISWDRAETAKALLESELGALEPKEFFEKLLPFMREKISFEQFSKEWTSIFEIRQTVLNLMKNLHLNNYKVGIVSNIDKIAYQSIASETGLENFTDSIVTSYQVGALKPDKKLFEKALEELGEEAGNCVFIDDVQKYVEKARELGLNAIQFKNFEQLEKDLEELGVKTGGSE